MRQEDFPLKQTLVGIPRRGGGGGGGGDGGVDVENASSASMEAPCVVKTLTRESDQFYS
jgi:hypothetical protein